MFAIKQCTELFKNSLSNDCYILFLVYEEITSITWCTLNALRCRLFSNVHHIHFVNEFARGLYSFDFTLIQWRFPLCVCIPGSWVKIVLNCCFNDYQKSVWFYKTGLFFVGTFFKKWKRSWLVVCLGGSVRYYRNRNASRPQKSFDVKNDCIAVKSGKQVRCHLSSGSLDDPRKTRLHALVLTRSLNQWNILKVAPSLTYS